MPIRINLLSEQQVAEDLRRRDPVKRVSLAAVVVVALMLSWVSYLQAKVMGARSDAGSYDGRFKRIEARYKQARAGETRLLQAQNHLARLQQLASSRLLWGDVLNGLQYSLVDDVQFTLLRTEQVYTLIPGTPPQTNAGVVTPGRPAQSKESIVLSIEAKDYSTRPGDQIFKLREKIGSHPYFKTNLSNVEMVGLSQVQIDTSEPNPRPHVVFTLKCQFTDKTR